MPSDLAALAAEDGASPGHRTLAEKAFDTLHAAIISGRLAPGTRLPIEDLAALLEMSPMPIREAVRRLDAAGLVENIPHRGARVTELSATDLAEIYECRLELESLAVRRAAERFTPAHSRRARRALRALADHWDDPTPEISFAHARFHFSLYEAAGSAWLLRLIRPVWECSERYCLDADCFTDMRDRESEHEEILEACEAGDPDRAAGALQDHLATTANELAEAMGAEPMYPVGAPGA